MLKVNTPPVPRIILSTKRARREWAKRPTRPRQIGPAPRRHVHGRAPSLVPALARLRPPLLFKRSPSTRTRAGAAQRRTRTRRTRSRARAGPARSPSRCSPGRGARCSCRKGTRPDAPTRRQTRRPELAGPMPARSRAVRRARGREAIASDLIAPDLSRAAGLCYPLCRAAAVLRDQTARLRSERRRKRVRDADRRAGDGELREALAHRRRGACTSSRARSPPWRVWAEFKGSRPKKRSECTSEQR